MLRQVDRRWKILPLRVQQSDLGSPQKRGLSALGTQTHPVDLQPNVPVRSPSQQGWQEAVCHRRNLPRRTDALRFKIRTIRAVSRWHLRRIRGFLERWPVGNLCFLSRWRTVAQQTGWQRALATHLPADVSPPAALVSRWEEDSLLRVRGARSK